MSHGIRLIRLGCVILRERQRVKDLPAALELLVDPSPRVTRLRMTVCAEQARTCVNSVTQRGAVQSMTENVFFRETGVIDHRALIGRENQMNDAIASLQCIRICIRSLARNQVAAMRISLIAVRRDRRRQRCSIIHAVVVDEQQVATF